MDLRLLTEHLMWGDARLLALLEELDDEEFHREFTELSGNIHTKTAHIVSIYDFFVSILEHRPHSRFPDLTGATSRELLARWRTLLEIWPAFVATTPEDSLLALPLAGNRRVAARHVFLDALLHTTHHRGQLLTFIRLLGKTGDEISPADTNLDYLKFLFELRPDLVHAPVESAA